ncbi:MAG: trigger factor [Caldilineaceae bacterium]|nr:trigger factor [Caldilineaceae bacterium]
MSLKISTEPKENRQLEMIIEVGQERVDQELRKAARKVAGQLRIPGFRQGRAPYNMVVRHVGMGALFEEFVDELGQEVFRTAIEQENIEPYATASLDNIDLDPLRYTLTIPLSPEVKLGDYRSLRVEEVKPEIDEAQVQERIDNILEREAGYVDVDRPSEYGDLITIDVRAVVLDKEGNETETVVLDENDWDITPDQENPMEPMGFDEELVGMEPNAEKIFDIAWPEDSPSMYAGKDVRFHVTVHTIKAYQKPELTDEIAQSIGEYETADALLESIRESLREEQAAEAESEYLEKVLEEIVEMSELDYPPAAVDLELDQMARNTDMQVRQMGLQGLEHFLQLTGQTMQQYRDGLREQAERLLRRSLVIGQIADAERIKPTEAEFDERLNRIFGAGDEDATDEQKESRDNVLDMMRRAPNRAVIDEQIISEKTVARILAIARGEEVPELGADVDEAPAEEAAAEEASAEMASADGPSAEVAEEVTDESAAEPVAEFGEEVEHKES